MNKNKFGKGNTINPLVFIVILSVILGIVGLVYYLNKNNKNKDLFGEAISSISQPSMTISPISIPLISPTSGIIKPISTTPSPTFYIQPITPKPPITIQPITTKPPITIQPITPKPPITIQPITPKPPITIQPITPKPPITIQPNKNGDFKMMMICASMFFNKRSPEVYIFDIDLQYTNRQKQLQYKSEDQRKIITFSDNRIAEIMKAYISNNDIKMNQLVKSAEETESLIFKKKYLSGNYYLRITNTTILPNIVVRIPFNVLLNKNNKLYNEIRDGTGRITNQLSFMYNITARIGNSGYIFTTAQPSFPYFDNIKTLTLLYKLDKIQSKYTIDLPYSGSFQKEEYITYDQNSINQRKKYITNIFNFTSKSSTQLNNEVLNDNILLNYIINMSKGVLLNYNNGNNIDNIDTFKKYINDATKVFVDPDVNNPQMYSMLTDTKLQAINSLKTVYDNTKVKNTIIDIISTDNRVRSPLYYKIYLRNNNNNGIVSGSISGTDIIGKPELLNLGTRLKFNIKGSGYIDINNFDSVKNISLCVEMEKNSNYKLYIPLVFLLTAPSSTLLIDCSFCMFNTLDSTNTSQLNHMILGVPNNKRIDCILETILLS